MYRTAFLASSHWKFSGPPPVLSWSVFGSSGEHTGSKSELTLYLSWMPFWFPWALRFVSWDSPDYDSSAHDRFESFSCSCKDSRMSPDIAKLVLSFVAGCFLFIVGSNSATKWMLSSHGFSAPSLVSVLCWSVDLSRFFGFRERTEPILLLCLSYDCALDHLLQPQLASFDH